MRRIRNRTVLTWTYGHLSHAFHERSENMPQVRGSSPWWRRW